MDAEMTTQGERRVMGQSLSLLVSSAAGGPATA